MSSKHNEVNSEVKYESYHNCLKTYFMNILGDFSDDHTSPQNWTHQGQIQDFPEGGCQSQNRKG